MTVKYELGTQKDKCWKLKGTVRVPVNVSWLNLPLFVASALKLHVDSDCCWFDVALNRRVLPRDGNLLRIEALDSEIILTLSTELIESSVLIVHCDSWIFCLFISPLVPLRLCSAFGLPRLPSFSHSASLSLLHLYLTLSKTQHQNTFSLNAGATKEVNSPTAHKGIWHGAGATRSWLHSGRLQTSFAEIEKSVDALSVTTRYTFSFRLKWSRTHSVVWWMFSPVWGDFNRTRSIRCACGSILRLMKWQVTPKNERHRRSDQPSTVRVTWSTESNASRMNLFTFSLNTAMGSCLSFFDDIGLHLTLHSFMKSRNATFSTRLRGRLHLMIRHLAIAVLIRFCFNLAEDNVVAVWLASPSLVTSSVRFSLEAFTNCSWTLECFRFRCFQKLLEIPLRSL